MPSPRSPCFPVSRRRFLRQCATTAALMGLPSWFVERQLQAAAEGHKRPGPNNRPGIALIGCGKMGLVNARNAAHHGDILAVCDVDANRGAAAAAELAALGRRPRLYHDFRRLLERHDIPVIINATPDHWHTLVNLAAIQAGKDVYCEKPLTFSIDEGRRVVRAVQAHGTVLQTGSQQRSSERFRLACELVRNGRIGRLKGVNVWLPAGQRGGPFATAPVPAGLDWDFWLGPAPKVPYVPERGHVSFRHWFDYAGGTLTDWGAHHLDIASWALGLIAPRTVTARPLSRPVPGGYTAFGEYEINYAYETGLILGVRSTADDNGGGEPVNPDGQRNGIRFEGTDGWIWVNRDRIAADDSDRLRLPLPDDAVRLLRSNDHMGNFMDCILTRQMPVADAETGHRSASLCHLGNIALRTGRTLTWDENNERFVGDAALGGNRLLARTMRRPYDYSFVG